MRRLLTIILLAPLYVYRYSLGLLLRRHCRFHPSCSGYAIEAIRCHGPWHGSIMAAKRIGRCRPGYPGGVDLVPNQSQTVTIDDRRQVAP
ncbi:MAG: membrane protein insertion efficiency factor YidD [Gammaproteobacteria bacterium]|nr:membrane protein insertion efficiency factor YidD [Gammaproteobacteria bacterium]